MSTSNTPRLCGGTFFTLLLQAKVPQGRSTSMYPGSNNSVSNFAMLEALIRVMDPDFIKPPESTFKSNASQYKACEISKGTYLPFEDATIIKAFDDMIKSDYSNPLRAMEAFLSSFINIKSESKRTWLVKALLELIETDDSVKDNDLFYILEDRKAVTKNTISRLTDICLEPFILGIWHFIIMNRPDNEIGKATVEQWHKAPETSGRQHKFISKISEGIIRDIRIKMLDLDNVDAEYEPEVTVEDDHTDANTNQEDFNDDPKENSGTQTINNPIVFNQNGNNNVQIGNIATLTINN